MKPTGASTGLSAGRTQTGLDQPSEPNPFARASIAPERAICALVATQQDYCDWCGRTLTKADQELSVALGFAIHEAWACRECIESGRTAGAPEGWADDEHWPPPVDEVGTGA
jgi:hypothetical protein